MKKKFFLCIFFIISLNTFSNTPDTLIGIWKNADRYIFFGSEGQISIILKEYYGWYYDRAAEPSEFSSSHERDRNAAVSRDYQIITAIFLPIENDSWEMQLNYNGKEISSIPITLINEKLYLDFLIKKEPLHDEDNIINEERKDIFWAGVNSAESIRIHPRENKKNVISWYQTENDFYRLNFWQTDMDFLPESHASFSDFGKIFTIQKHIFSAGTNYTCSTGRSKIIRNVEKYASLPFEKTFNTSQTVCAIGEPYLEKISESSEVATLINIVKEANQRRAPDRKPLFEEKELDWHWDLINQSEKYNKLIQEVRKRQYEFGNRGKETEAGR